jgi:cytochrome P450
MADALPHASLIESVRFNQSVIVPNAVQGLFRRRPAAVGVATRLNVDGQAVGLMRGMRKHHGRGPVWTKVMTADALVMLDIEDVRRVLEGSPHPFASDPEAKRKGMGAFQPDALTISRGGEWEKRRRFTETVLDTPQPVPRHGERFAAVVSEETDALIEAVGDGELDYDALLPAYRRIVRRIVLGDSARDDEGLSEMLAELMAKGNGLPSEPPEELGPFMERIRSYVEAGEEGSLVALFGDALADPETKPEGQVPHWLFALQDTTSMNTMRALAAIVSHPDKRARLEDELAQTSGPEPSPYMRACVHDAMRLWPTTPLLSRETVEDVAWNGETVPAGTQLMIVNTFHHRDPDRVAYADRFAPEEWIDGTAAEDWSFNHFSHGPQGCPGVNLALLVGGGVLGHLLTGRQARLESPKLDPAKPLPHMLNVFGLRFRLG